MKELVFVGLGLNDEKSMSIKGLEEARTADSVFIELYTSLLPDFSIKNLEHLVGKKIQILSRSDLEEKSGIAILNAAENGKAVFLIPGDPFIATTHVTLRIDAAKRKISTRIIHGASIISAIVGLSGLHNYNFGKAVTIPFQENFSETPYNVIFQNKKVGLHSLCLLDLKAEEKRFLAISEALQMLERIEEKRKLGIATRDTLVIGIARAGSNQPVLKAESIASLQRFNFGEPPMSIIFPGKMHFMEIEALIAIAGAPAELRSLTK